jgi:hypothetical protein
MRTQLKYRSILLSAGVVLALCACAHESDRPAPQTTTTAAAVWRDDAVQQIATARCERAAECNNLVNGPYGNRRECIAAYRQDPNLGMANATMCTEGIDKAKLDKCVAVLRAQTCYPDMGPVSAMRECDRPLCARSQ